jgi:hypothetical protein
MGRVLHSVPPSTLRLTTPVLSRSSGIVHGVVVAEGKVDIVLPVSALAGSGRGMGSAACSGDGRKAGCMPKSLKAPEVSFSKRAADAAGSGGGGGGGRGRGSLAMGSGDGPKAKPRVCCMAIVKRQMMGTKTAPRSHVCVCGRGLVYCTAQCLKGRRSHSHQITAHEYTTLLGSNLQRPGSNALPRRGNAHRCSIIGSTRPSGLARTGRGGVHMLSASTSAGRRSQVVQR